MNDSAPTVDAGARIVGGGALAFAAACYLCFALPVSLYAENPLEFSAPWPVLLRPLVLAGAIAVLVSAVMAAMLPSRSYRRVLVLASALCLLAWIQGTVLVWNYGLLDGAQIDWSSGRWRGVVDASLWIFVLLAADAYRERLVRVLPRVAIVLCLLQVVVAISQVAFHGKQRDSSIRDASLGQLDRFSARGNVLQILADGMQTDVVADVLNERGGVAGRQFDGFVLFEDNLGAFPYTHMSVPAMLGGRLYDNSMPQSAFLSEALGRGSVLGAARAAGYDVVAAVPGGGIRGVYDFVTDGQLFQVPSAAPEASWRGPLQESLRLGDLVLFRIAPHFAKRFVYNDQSWLLQTIFGSVDVPGQSFLIDNAFLQGVANRATVQSGPPAYRYFHLMLSHRPMVMNRDCTYAGRILPAELPQVRNQTRCALRSIAAVLARMRQLGIYDDATIVIAGDHGTFVAPSTILPGSAAASAAYAAGIPPRMIGQARPVLLVKRPHSRGPLMRSQVPTSVGDIPATIADAAGIPLRVPGNSAFRLDASPRRRRFGVYAYQGTDWRADYLSPIQEFSVVGPGLEVASWSKGEIELAPAGRR